MKIRKSTSGRNNFKTEEKKMDESLLETNTDDDSELTIKFIKKLELQHNILSKLIDPMLIQSNKNMPNNEG